MSDRSSKVQNIDRCEVVQPWLSPPAWHVLVRRHGTTVFPRSSRFEYTACLVSEENCPTTSRRRSDSEPRRLSKEWFSIMTTTTWSKGMDGSGVPAGRPVSGRESGRRRRAPAGRRELGPGPRPRATAPAVAPARSRARRVRRASNGEGPTSASECVPRAGDSTDPSGSPTNRVTDG